MSDERIDDFLEEPEEYDLDDEETSTTFADLESKNSAAEAQKKEGVTRTPQEPTASGAIPFCTSAHALALFFTRQGRQIRSARCTRKS